MPTTKAQRSAACGIIERFTADDVTFPVEFVLALLNDAEKLEDAIKDRYEAIRERDAAITDAVSFSNMYKEAEYEFEQLKRTYFLMLENAGASNVQEIIDERDRLSDEVDRLMRILADKKNVADLFAAEHGSKIKWEKRAFRLSERAEAAEAKLEVAVDALEEIKILHGIPEYHGQALSCGVEDRCLQSDGYGGADYGWEDAAERFSEWANGMAEHALAKIKGAP